MAESRLQRWSRKKARAGKDTEATTTPSAVEPTVESSSPEEQALAVNETLSESELLEKYGLPDPDAIELGTDVTGFMRKEIPEMLRRRALRSLWKSNPVLAVLDGLNDYDEDFTDAANTLKSVKTLYKVGQGFDRTPAVEEQPAEQIEDPIPEHDAVGGEPEIDAAPENAESESVEVAADTEKAVTSEVSGHFDPAASTAVAVAADKAEPRYRPRMRFDH